ncbi:hypothetical protein ACP4OV_016975 [Aristida adscensionis]
MAALQPRWEAPLLAVLLLLLLVAGEASAADPPTHEVCPRPIAAAAILGLGAPRTCPTACRNPVHLPRIIEGNEAVVGWSINFVHRFKGTYVAVLFYASWCPFSQEFLPHFEKSGYLFPTILHFAFEESRIKTRTKSAFGIQGYPTLFIMNSSMRVQYHGPRSVTSLAAFYTAVSGINASLDPTIGEVPSPTIKLRENANQENCIFCWARLLEKNLQQDIFLPLAVSFLILRLIYLLAPKIISFARWTWRRHTLFTNLTNIHDYFFSYLEQGRLKFNRIYPSKQVNLHDEARNASAWASKSLASVSIAEPIAGG